MAHALPAPEPPLLLKFPKNMLKPKRVFKKQRNYSNVMLLKFPLEILLIVLNKSGLTVYDRAALALTCRMLALTVSREPGLLLLTQELTHGSEELHREIFNDNGFPGYNATDEDIDRWATERKQHDRDCRSRTDPKELRDFMLRLDKGWNRAQSRHCMTCNKFVPINEQYWHQKDTLFTYNCDTKTARAWRRGVCTHYERIKLGEDAREFLLGLTVKSAAILETSAAVNVVEPEQDSYRLG